MSQTAVITEIERFALYDGPGIRTAVFLKGCPLHCVWCHNPECIRPEAQLRVQWKKCVGCKACTAVCPQAMHSFSASGEHRVAFSRCVQCGACTAACPTGALSFFGKEMTVEEVMAVVRRDRRYYEKSGGGLTVSGGEPMARLPFLAALLAAAKNEGFHTAVETSGFASRQAFETILPLTDLFLFDFKESDPVLHRQFTGQENGPILDQLSFLVSHGAEIILRCPIIPSCNDREAHFIGIADLLCRFPAIRRCECMAYHTLGIAKYREIGEEYTLEAQPLSEKRKEEILKTINARSPVQAIWG